MRPHRRLSTLHLLGMFAFTALALNDDHFILGVGSFKLSPFDLLFVAMLGVKALRLADPRAYALPRGALGVLLGIQAISVIYLLLVSLHHPGIETGDVARDLRIVFYFLCTPFLCYKDIDSPAAYAVLQKYIVAACLAVATLMLLEQAQGFSVANPLRNVRLGVWAIPFGVVSLLYFRRTLNVSGPKAYALTVYMLLALVFSLNRSQYLQLMVSVLLYIVIPVILAQLWRRALLRQGQAAFDAALARIGPLSMAALLLTLVLLFAFQGEAILRQPLVIAMLAVPILIQVLFNSGLAYWLNRQVGEQHRIACPSALIGASNFFELAVAAAISLFGFQSGAALATVVGVLIEVPVMLLVVRVVNRSRGWYECGPNPPSR